MKLVISKFIAYEENDQDSAGNGQGETEYVDKWEYLVFKNISHCNFKVIAKHIVDLEFQAN